jgi:hypothetical protein
MGGRNGKSTYEDGAAGIDSSGSGTIFRRIARDEVPGFWRSLRRSADTIVNPLFASSMGRPVLRRINAAIDDHVSTTKQRGKR